MSELKKFTVHLHATFTPTAELDGGKVMVVMGEPEVTECDCKPAPGSKVAYRDGLDSKALVRAIQRAQKEDK